MAIAVQTNVSSINTTRRLNAANHKLDTSYQRLSSGMRINSAKDDAAGLQISNRMTSQINGYTQGNRNANDGIALAQTAEGALNEVHDMLQRLNELAVQSANGTLVSSQDRAYVQLEVSQLIKEIDDVANNTKFNGISLLNVSTSVKLQVGTEASHTMTVSLEKMTSSGLGVNSVNVGTQAGAKTAIDSVKTGINKLNKLRAKLGAYQNRLEHKIANLDNVVENTTAAESRIRDTDMATEMVKYSNQNILQQAGQAMLAQSNQSNQGVLSLLG